MPSNKNIIDFIVERPEAIWLVGIVGAICVIGVVDYLRCFFENKKKSMRWVVLIFSLFVSVIFSPYTPTALAVMVIFFLFILAIASIGKKALIDGIPNLISKILGSVKKEVKE